MTKAFFRNALAFLVSVALLVTSVFFICPKVSLAATLAEQQKELSSLQDEYSRAVQNTQTVKNQLAAKTTQINNKEYEKTLLDTEITALTGQIKTAENLINEYSSYIEEKEQEKQELYDKKSEQEEMLGAMLRLSYKYGDASYIDILLGAQSISDFIQRIDFLAYHMKYSSTLLSDINSTTATLEEITTNLGLALDSVNSIKEETESAKQELEEKLARVDTLIIQLNADAKTYREMLAQKEADRLAIEKEMKELAAAIAAREKAEGKTPTTSFAIDGMLGWPLVGYSMKNLTSSYGTRRDPITGQSAFHNGLDVGAPYGTNILAAESGTIIRASWYGTYGNCVMIDHGAGLITLYAHCSGYNVKVGQTVTKGDVIAYVGSTGRSTGNHLHFTVFIDGQTTDPGKYLS